MFQNEVYMIDFNKMNKSDIIKEINKFYTQTIIWAVVIVLTIIIVIIKKPDLTIQNNLILFLMFIIFPVLFCASTIHFMNYFKKMLKNKLNDEKDNCNIKNT